MQPDAGHFEREIYAIKAPVLGEDGKILPNPTNHGDVDTAMRGAAKIVEGTYSLPYCSKARWEPGAATVLAVLRARVEKLAQNYSTDGRVKFFAVNVDRDDSVRALREQSDSLADFINTISWMTSFEQLQQAIQ